MARNSPDEPARARVSPPAAPGDPVRERQLDARGVRRVDGAPCSRARRPSRGAGRCRAFHESTRHGPTRRPLRSRRAWRASTCDGASRGRSRARCGSTITAASAASVARRVHGRSPARAVPGQGARACSRRSSRGARRCRVRSKERPRHGWAHQRQAASAEGVNHRRRTSAGAERLPERARLWGMPRG